MDGECDAKDLREHARSITKDFAGVEITIEGAGDLVDVENFCGDNLIQM